MRFAEGEYVVHPGQGVCLIVGIVQGSSIVGASADCPGHEERHWQYELSPLASPKVHIHYPVTREETLRPVVGRDEALAVIADGPSMESDHFEKPQSWTVREHFMELLRGGDCREAMRVTKSLYERMEEAQTRGRKPRSCYASIFEEARQRLLDELSIALDMPAEQVEGLIRKSFGIEAALPA